MKKLCTIAAMVGGVALGTLPVRAQDEAKKKGPPKAAKSLTESVLEQWNDIGRKLIAMAEDFPEDKYDFKPTKEERTFAEQLLHAAGSNYSFINLAKGEKPTTEEDAARSKYKTKADVVAFVKKSFADGADVIKAKGDAGLQGFMVDPFQNQQVRVIDWAYGFPEHSGEHYGQLVVYYRVAGLVPPESRAKK